MKYVPVSSVRMPLVPSPVWPVEVREAVHHAACVELDYALSYYKGLPQSPDAQYRIEDTVARVLERYRDILHGYYWAVFLDGWRWEIGEYGDVVVLLVEKITGPHAANLEFKSRFRTVG